MSKPLIRLIALLPLAALALPAQAQLARSFSSATYTGTGASQLSADFDNLGEAINLEAVGGFHITPQQSWGKLSAELNLNITVAPGENEGPPRTTTTPGGPLSGGGVTSTEQGKFTTSQNDLQAFIFTLQGVYRTPGRFYGMATAGYSLINTSIEEIEENGRSSASFGGGIGYRFGANTAAVEVQFTRVSEDLQTIGLRFVY